MKKISGKFNKLMNSDSSTIYLFLYGLIVQSIALAAIYCYNLAYEDLTSVFKILIFIWFCIPVLSVFSAIIAIIQIRKRKIDHEKYKLPLIGLILNIAWLLCYLVGLHMALAIWT